MTPNVQPLITEPTPSRRRWFRFSLRSFFVFTTLAACLLGWVAKERSQSEFERQVGKKLEEKNCHITFLGPYDSLELYVKVEPQGWWRDLARSVLGERISQIKWSGEQDGFRLLSDLKNLEQLSFGRMSVSDLTPLAGLKQLKYLFLTSTSVSDLSPLAGLKNLKILRISGRYTVSVEQIKSLQQALPNCRINW